MYFVLVLIIGIAVLVGLAVIARRNERNEESPSGLPGQMPVPPPTPEQQAAREKEDRLRKIGLAVGIIVAAVALAVVAFKLVRDPSSGGSVKEGGKNFASFLPIWVAVFVPSMIAAQKKKQGGAKSPVSAEARRILLILAVVLLLAGAALGLYLAKRMG